MKWILAVGLSLIMMTACQNNQSNDEKLIATDVIMNPNSAENKGDEQLQLPICEFEYQDYDFGLIYQGEKVAHKFKFKNTGNANLIISDVSASCGCTVPKYSRKPVKPGEEGYIEVEFDSAGREGQQVKSVTVLANTQPNRMELSFIAEVEIPN